ncbi:MAG: hypothetical protein PWR10_874 [Halanaerobiales bacterium]|nr:hypothetical protein [Halanaerobiales bacterium]
MKRKQIYITKELDEKLKDIAYILNRSESALIRDALDEYLIEKERIIKENNKKNPLMKLVGLGESKRNDSSENHDRYLYLEADDK